MTTPGARPGGDEVPARFATGGHDTEAFGATAGYPKGDLTTFRDLGSLVGSHSHLDEIFPARLIHRAAKRYQYGRTDRHRFASWSMAKTVTAMLVGIAIAGGRIHSVGDLAADYVPELIGAEYGRTSLRHLLQMSSGVHFTEEYTGTDDMARLTADTYLGLGPGGPAAVEAFNNRVLQAFEETVVRRSVPIQNQVISSSSGRP